MSRRDLEPLSGDAVRFLPEVRASGWTVYSVETAEGVSPESHGVEELATDTDKAVFSTIAVVSRREPAPTKLGESLASMA